MGRKRHWHRFETLESRLVLSGVVPAAATDLFLHIPTELTGLAGHHLIVPLDITDATGVRSADITINYDAAVLTNPSVSATTAADSVWPSGTSVVANTTTAGTIVVTVYSATTISSGAGSLLTIDFTIADAATVGTQTAIDLQIASLNEGAVTYTPTPQSGADDTDGEVTVVAENLAPVLADIETAALAYTENDPATAITSTITVSDDDANLTSATVQITGNYQSGEDVLSFTNTATITGVWDATTGTMTLSGPDTVANYQAALRAVKYHNSSDNPSVLTRTATFKVNDGTYDSNELTRNIIVVAVNDAPVLAEIEPTPLVYTENDPATAITSTITVSDVDSAILTSATVQITSNYQSGEDELSFTNTATITGVWNATTGTMTLTGNDTPANYEAALRAVKYHNTSDNPSVLTRTVTFKVNDGTDDSNELSRNITVVAVNDAPVLAGIEMTSLTYTENESAKAISLTITVNDVDSAILTGATVQITGNYQNGQDELSFVNTSTITGTWNATTGTMTLTGNDTVANYQTALRAVKYRNSSDNPSVLTRTATFKVNDGIADSNEFTRNIAVAAVNDAPVLAEIETIALAYTENDSATAITSTITVSDVDSANLAYATVQITGNYQSGEDELSFTNTPIITGNWNATTGTMTLTGSSSSGTLANFEAALRAVKYHNTSDDPSVLTRTATFKVNDGIADSNLLTRNITVNSNNSATGQVSGYVYSDTHENNSPDIGNPYYEGVPGVLITLTRTDQSGSDQTAWTDDNGKFEFSGVQAGTYRLTERQPSAIIDGGNNSISNIQVAAGGNVAGQNFREICLKPQYVYNRLLATSTLPTGSTQWNQVIRQIIIQAEKDAGVTPLPPSQVTTQSAVSEQTTAIGQALLAAPDSEVMSDQSPPTVSQSLAPLSADELKPIVDEAIADWAKAGLPTAILNRLYTVTVSVADLSDSKLGWTENNLVSIDRDAAGCGWFVDPTPAQNEEFVPDMTTGQLQAVDPRALAGMDLLTVVKHELGHVMGLNDNIGSSWNDLMTGALTMGARRKVSAADIDAVLAAFTSVGWL